MKIITVLGTRPELIRLSKIISLLDRYSNHFVVHTGQNYSPSLRDLFFKDLNIREPNIYLGIEQSAFGRQAGEIISQCEDTFLKERPDRVLILGDTNSGLAAIPAKKLGIEVYHMEAGNRCYDDRVPEEINRRIIDHSSDVLLPYTYRSKENLVREGIKRERIFVTGNPIFEIIKDNWKQITRSKILAKLGLKRKGFFLVTLHRAENVDIPERLENFIEAFDIIADRYKLPVICSLHPRTRQKMDAFKARGKSTLVRYLEPFGFHDFLKLESNALCVLTDSGTVQEECCILKISNATLRDVTERPETIECGSNILCGNNPKRILETVQFVLSRQHTWVPPAEYTQPDVSEIVLKILLGYHE